MIRHTLKPITAKDKIKQVVTSIELLAQEKGEGNKLPTVREMAQAFDISVTTVDKALNILSKRGIVTRKWGSGVYVSFNYLPQIAIVFDFKAFCAEETSYNQLVFKALQKQADCNRYKLVFYMDIPAANDESVYNYDLMEGVKSGRLSGAVIFSGHKDLTDMLQEYSIPTVCIGSLGGNVSVDYLSLINKGVEALGARGARSIALVAGVEQEGRPGDEYVRKFKRSLKKHGLTFCSDLIAECDYGMSHERMGYALVKGLFAKGSPDGILFLDDVIARGGMTALQEMGVALGSDLHVVTHTNKGSSVLAHYEGCVDFLEVDHTEVAQAVFRLLGRIISNTSDSVGRVKIKPRLKKSTDR